MPDQSQPPKRRRLRPTSETVRERAERSALAQRATPARVSRPKRALMRLGKVGGILLFPLRFIGSFIVPPYVRSSWRELRQVTWPNRKQTRQLTLAVILFAVMFGAVIAAFDYGLERLFKQVIVK